MAALALFVASPAVSYAQRPAFTNRVKLPGSIRPVAPGGTASSSSVPASLVRSTLTPVEAVESIHVQMVLKMRNFEELERRVAAGETIGRTEMASRFLPLESDHQAVAQWFAAQGVSVTAAGASHTVVAASGTPGQFQKAFQTSFARVAFRDAEYTAAVDSPSVPSEIENRVSNIHGLQPYLHPRKSGRMREAAVTSDYSPPYLVGDILRAYNVDTSGLTGAGQQIGVVIDTVPASSDLTRFWSDNGVNQSLSNIVTVNVTGAQLPTPDGEETLDVSWSSGIASGAQIIIYACADLNNVNDAYSRILDDLQSGSRPNLHQVTMSYGAGEVTDETPSDMNSAHQLYTAMTAYGVSIFASSGDDGAYGNGGRTQQVVYPASDPSVTGVGGTSLYLNYSNGTVTNETAWSTDGSSRDDSSSGGGISSYFARPPWQVGGTVPGGTMRLVPDVALAADPATGCYLIYKGRTQGYGGTSWAAPSWAALCALINQARAAGGQKPLGLANSALYPLIGTTNFRDIASGDNGPYYAGAGYDLVTGLGVPNFAVLLNSLRGTTTTIAQAVPVITGTTTASGRAGEAFSYQIAASNTPTAFAANGLPGGLTVDPATGLISGTPMAAGTFTVSLGATNAAGTGTAQLVLTITASTAPVVTLAATVPQALSSSGEPGEFTVSIPAALPSDLKISYIVKGSAVNGTDYTYLKGFTKIKAGKTSKVLRIAPQDNLDGVAKKVVKLKLVADAAYVIGTPGALKVDILDE